MDGTTCVNDKYVFACGTEVDVNSMIDDYTGIMQYGYEDESCSSLDYYMQYGCAVDAEECIDLEPFGAPDSAKVYCSAGNASTLHYGGNFDCAGSPDISNVPVDTCDSFTSGIDDLFSQGDVLFVGTSTRKIFCTSGGSNDDDDTLSLAIVAAIVLCIIVGAGSLFFAAVHCQGKKRNPYPREDNRNLL